MCGMPPPLTLCLWCDVRIALEKWKLLKEEMEHAVREGKANGFDDGLLTFENGCFYAYDYVLSKMNLYDNDNREECSND